MSATFIGFGYLYLKNELLRPSPLLVTYNDFFGYVALGFLSSFRPYPVFEVGFNAQVDFAYGSKSVIQNVPPEAAAGQRSITMMIADKVQYSFEFPLSFVYKDSSGVFRQK